MRRLAVAFWICLGWPRLVQAEPSAVERRARELLAQGVEQTVPAETIASLGPEVAAALLAIFGRATEPRHVRLRALSMLARNDELPVTRWFVRLLRAGLEPAPGADPDPLHPARSSLVLRRAIMALTTRSAPEVSADLLRALAHRDAQVRRAAVRGLAVDPSPQVRAALSAHLARETSPLVRRALTDRSARPRAPRSIAPESEPQPR